MMLGLIHWVSCCSIFQICVDVGCTYESLPSGIAQSRENVFVLREAEIKHARLAMLAAVGWPFSELYHYQISSTFGLNNLLGADDRAPSVLNGGLDNVYVLCGLGTFFAVGIRQDH